MSARPLAIAPRARRYRTRAETAALVREILRLRRTGLGYPEIARQLGLSRQHAGALARAAGVRICSPASNERDGRLELRLRPQDFAVLQEMYAASGRSAGMVLDSFARELLEGCIASHRLSQIPPPPTPSPKPIAEEIIAKIKWLARVDPNLGARPSKALAQRFGISESSVRKILGLDRSDPRAPVQRRQRTTVSAEAEVAIRKLAAANSDLNATALAARFHISATTARRILRERPPDAE